MELRAALRELPGAGTLPRFDDEALLPPPGRALENAPQFLPKTAPPLPRLELPRHVLRPFICGPGPVMAAMTVGELFGREPAAEPLAGVVNLGIAGSYDLAAAPLGSLLLATEECLPEYGIWPEAGELLPPDANAPQEAGGTERTAAFPPDSSLPGVPRPMSLPQTRLPDGPVHNRLFLDADAALGKLDLNCHTPLLPGLARGTGLTVAGVSGTRARAARMTSLFQGLFENMEGFSLALASLRANLPFVELRAVSNAAGQRPPSGWDLPLALAALATAARALFAPES